MFLTLPLSWREAGVTKRISVARSAFSQSFDQGLTAFLGAFLSMLVSGSGLEAYPAL